MEEALYNVALFREFVGLDAGKTACPGAGGLTAVLSHDRRRRRGSARLMGIAGAS